MTSVIDPWNVNLAICNRNGEWYKWNLDHEWATIMILYFLSKCEGSRVGSKAKYKTNANGGAFVKIALWQNQTWLKCCKNNGNNQISYLHLAAPGIHREIHYREMAGVSISLGIVLAINYYYKLGASPTSLDGGRRLGALKRVFNNWPSWMSMSIDGLDVSICS